MRAVGAKDGVGSEVDEVFEALRERECRKTSKEERWE